MPTAKKQNPEGNTGLNLQSWDVRLDYLNLTHRLKDKEEVYECFSEVAYLWEEFNGLIWTEDKGINKGRYYSHTASTVHGTKFAFHPAPTGGYDVWISIPGRVLSRVSGEITWLNCKRLKSRYGLCPTRVDIAIDDYEKLVPVCVLTEALEAGNYVGFSKYSIHQNGGKKVAKNAGWTVYLGSRKSDKMYRYYDKETESNGEIKSYRWEVELKDFKAKQFWDLYTQVPGKDVDSGYQLACELMVEVVIGGIDFRDLSVDKNMSRCPKLDWWDFMVCHFRSSGGVKLGAKRSRSSLEKTVAWVKRQVETSLAMLRDVLGAQTFHGFIKDAIDSGRMRYGRQHEAILRLHVGGYDTLQLNKV